MKVIRAKIVDRTHLELSQPIEDLPGEYVDVTIMDVAELDQDWKAAARERFLTAFADQDAIYDEL